MDNQKKISIIEECMDLDEGTLRMDTDLTGFEEWDSVTALSIIAMVDEYFHKTITGAELKKARTVSDVVSLME